VTLVASEPLSRGLMEGRSSVQAADDGAFLVQMRAADWPRSNESFYSPNANLIGGHKISSARQSRIDIFWSCRQCNLRKSSAWDSGSARGFCRALSDARVVSPAFVGCFSVIIDGTRQIRASVTR
jgi:hypothetical protein